MTRRSKDDVAALKLEGEVIRDGQYHAPQRRVMEHFLVHNKLHGGVTHIRCVLSCGHSLLFALSPDPPEGYPFLECHYCRRYRFATPPQRRLPKPRKLPKPSRPSHYNKPAQPAQPATPIPIPRADPILDPTFRCECPNGCEFGPYHPWTRLRVQPPVKADPRFYCTDCFYLHVNVSVTAHASKVQPAEPVGPAADLESLESISVEHLLVRSVQHSDLRREYFKDIGFRPRAYQNMFPRWGSRS